MSPIGLLPALVIAGLAGALLAAVAVAIWQRRHGRPLAPAPEPAPETSPPRQEASPRQEAQRFFLMNETGNVLISTSLSPTGRLPDSTLALFSEALAHLSAIFFAIVGSTDPNTDEPFSLYNYAVLKRALALHPVFIRTSVEKPEAAPSPLLARRPIVFGFQPGPVESPEAAQQARHQWLDDRVQRSRDALGLPDSAENAGKLRSIHAQMRAEAERLGTSRFKTLRMGAASIDLLQAPKPSHTDDTTVDLEVGHITLYCECLMGVSLVSVKLAHAHYHDYLHADTLKMEEDTYLFVSPSQLRATLHELNHLPRASMAR